MTRHERLHLADERRTYHEQQITRGREQRQHRREALAVLELERTDLVDDDDGVRGRLRWRLREGPSLARRASEQDPPQTVNGARDPVA